MTSLSTVTLVCLLISLGGCDVINNNNVPVSKCPPAEIGKPFTLEYTAYALVDISFDSWKVENNESSIRKVVATCDVVGCHITRGQVYTAEIHMPMAEIKSRLSISPVTSDMESMVFISNATLNVSGVSVIHMTCAMNLYLVPVKPLCNAQLMKGGGVHVTCNTSSVYPGLVCEMYEQAAFTGVDSGVMTPITQNIKYSNHSLSEESLKAAECSTVVFPETPGVYRYVVNMYPLLHNSGLRLSPSIAVSNAVSTRSTRVELEEFPYIYLCPHRKDVVSFICRAMGFSEAPQFFWHIGNMTVKAERVEETTLNNTSDFVYSVTYNFTPMRSDHKTVVTCEVNSILPGTTILTKITDSKELVLDWPDPYPVAFKSVGGVSLEESVYLGAGNVSRVKCELNGSDPDISHLAVVCWKDNQTNTFKVIDKDSKFVYFTVTNDDSTKNTTCKCSAVHTIQHCSYITTVMFYGQNVEKTAYSYPMISVLSSPYTTVSNAVSTMSTGVELEEFPYIYLCPHRKDIVSFICRAMGFSETPQFFLHIGNMTVKAEHVEETTLSNTNDFVYSVTYNFTPVISDHKTVVTCEVNGIFPGTAILTKITDSKELILDWPDPYPVAFKSQTGVTLGKSVYLGTRNDTLVCEINRLDPNVSRLAVVCWKDNQTNIPLFEFRSTDSKPVLFTVPNDDKTTNITCECSAVHTTQQCNYTTTVMFYGHYAEKTTHGYPMIFVLGTLLATACIIVLILLGYLFYRRHKQPQNHECRYCEGHRYEAVDLDLVIRTEENVSESADPQERPITTNTCHEWVSSDKFYIDPRRDYDEESVMEQMYNNMPSCAPFTQPPPPPSPPPPPPQPHHLPRKLRVKRSVV